MMGWVVFAGLAVAAGLLLWLTGFPRRLWTVAATALMLAAAGYAWQGQPGLAGKSAVAEKRAGEVDPALIALRDSMFGRFGFESQYFAAADALMRAGSTGAAAKVMIGGVRKAPRDPALWSWLGLVLAENDGNQLSPAAKFALDKGVALSPNHPGTHFFYGMAHIRQGEFAKARPYWARAVELTPATLPFRDELVVRLFLLDRLLASQAAQTPPAR